MQPNYYTAGALFLHVIYAADGWAGDTMCRRAECGLGADVHVEFAGTIGEILADDIHRAVLSWREQGIELLPGLAIEEIRRLAKAVHINLSADIEHLYSLCGGMPRGTVDDQWFELRPLERLLHDAKKFPNSLLRSRRRDFGRNQVGERWTTRTTFIV